MSTFTKTTSKTSSQVEQPFIVPSYNKGRRVTGRPQQQVRNRRWKSPQSRQQRPNRPQYRGRFNNNRRRNNYRKKKLVPQKGTKIATGSLLDMAMIKGPNGSKVVKVQSSHNGKRVLKHASLNDVLTKKSEFKDSKNSFSALDQKEVVRKFVPRPSVIRTIAAPQGQWGTPLNSKVKEDKEFNYVSGSELEKKHLKRLAEIEEAKLAEQEIDRQIRTGQYEVEDWAAEMENDSEDEYEDNRKLGDGYDYDLSFQPDVDDADYEEYCQLQEELNRQEEEYNHQAEIVQMDGWYD